MKPKVLVVEDDTFTLATVAESLQQHGFDTPDSAYDLNSAVASFQKNDFAALLTDLDLGIGPSGIDLANQLRKWNPKLGVVFLSSYADPRLHRPNHELLPGGAKYLVKQSLVGVSEIADALHESIAQAKSNSQVIQAPEPLAFTEIQIQTMQLVARGLSNSEIASLRFVSEKAIEKTIKLVSEHLGISQDSTKNQRVSIAREYLKLTGGKA